ncbi:MAG: cytochrome c-type biogenesis protein CcmF [Myxococcota bacterium]
MISILGRTAILVALAACSTGAVVGFVGGAKGSKEAWRWSRLMAYLFFGACTTALLLMEYALITHDFSVSYVASVGSTTTPLWVTIVSLWSSLEGSILLWAFVLSGYTALFAYQTRDRYPEHTPWALGVTLTVGVFFTFLVAGVANPFESVPPELILAEGPGPNPLLQNHILMVIHPPSLYLGYVGMSVPFGMGCAALLAGRIGPAWSAALRKWTILPWGFLTAGIILGGWWSYEVLGWGGYWAWDPVENASFLPWLTATAFLHSAVMVERKGQLKGWAICLLLASFLLTLLGTFMTRSGVFNSVHSFTQSPIGPVFLGFLGICMVASLVLLALRIDTLSPPEEKKAGAGLVSRDSAFLMNNLLFAAFTFTVLLGTIYPLITEALTDTRLSVGEPYFNRMGVPVAMLIVFMMGVGPALPWGRVSREAAAKRLALPLGGGIAAAGLAAVLGVHDGLPLLSFGICGFALLSTLRELHEPIAARSKKVGVPYPAAALTTIGLMRRRFGGYTVHIGVIAVAVAVTASGNYKTVDEVNIPVGQSVEVQGYTLTFDGSRDEMESHRSSQVAQLSVKKGDRELGLLEPRLNNYFSMGSIIGTPAVRSGFDEDLYLSLIQMDDERVVLQVIIEPLVMWLWVGGGIMTFGTLIAAWPRRRRRKSKEKAA